MLTSIAMFVVLTSSYYTLTYSKSLWLEEQNPLGAFGAALLALAGLGVAFLALLGNQG